MSSDRYDCIMKVALATVAEIDPTHYHDPVSNQVFAVDHLTLVSLV